MNEALQRIMIEATQLTRSGQLQAATQAIQRALRSGSMKEFASGDLASPELAKRSSLFPGPEGRIILDGLTRVVDTATATATATTSEPNTQASAHRESTVAPANRSEAEVHYVEPSKVSRASGDAQAELWIDGSFTHQGRTLSYKLFVPSVVAGAVPTALPLVLMLHGCTQGASDFASGTQMNALAREHGVVVLYPEQTQHANSQKCWNWFKPQHQQRGRGEPAVLAALTQAITAKYDVDATRVYVAGLSAGGAMADIVGHCYPEIFAAVGVHSGLPSGSAKDLISALAVMRHGARAMSNSGGGSAPPTIVFHGDADSTVDRSNGAAIIKAVRQTDAGTPRGNTVPVSTEGCSANGQRFTRTVYEDAAGRGHAEYWQLHGAGHAWSGGSVDGSYTDPTGVDASAEMLRFFMSHSKVEVNQRTHFH